MYREHPSVIPPDNPDVLIWRYMTFSKFVDMLERRALHFSSLHWLPDPFEGFPSDSTLQQIRSRDQQVRARAIADGLIDAGTKWPSKPGDIYQTFRLITYVNCWNMSDYEFMAMWQLYSHDGVAIRSTFQHLIESLRDAPEQQSIGKVIYRDRRDPTHAEFPGGALEAAFRKGMSFAFEHELRAQILFDARPIGQTAYSYQESQRIQPKGKNVFPVDLEVLIDEVYVAPGRPLWFKELVERVVRTYRLEKPTVVSSLDERPDLT